MKFYFSSILTIAFALSLAHGHEGRKFVDLKGAKAATTHDNGGRCPARIVIDGNEETVWSSGGHDHTTLPANVFITLPKPASVAAIVGRLLKVV